MMLASFSDQYVQDHFAGSELGSGGMRYGSERGDPDVNADTFEVYSIV